MNTILKIFLLLTASKCALALCDNTCDKTTSCTVLYNCLARQCKITLSEEDLPDKCKCFDKCFREIADLSRRTENCFLFKKVKQCFQQGNCDLSKVDELKLYEDLCKNCDPNKCNQEESCFKQLECLTDKTKGKCSSAEDVKSALSQASKPMNNDWYLPGKCNCTAKCAPDLLMYVPSCMGYEMQKKCAFKHSCTLESAGTMNFAPCDCEYGCHSEASKVRKANETSKCNAKREFIDCAKKYGCGKQRGDIQNIICDFPTDNGTNLGSYLAAIIVSTILSAFITANVI